MKKTIVFVLALLMAVTALPARISWAEAEQPAQEGPYRISVSDQTQQTVKGWGVYPCSVGPDWLNKTVAQKAIYKDMGITQYRIELRGQAGDADGRIVNDVYGYFVSSIQLAMDYGVDRYSVHVWSPPPGMKDNNNISGFRDDGKQAKLLESKEQTFCDWVVRCFQGLEERGLPLPIAFSFSNEPDVVKEYQSCGYEMDQYIRVAKLMRRTLDAAGYAEIDLLGPEGGGYISNKRWFGENASSFDEDPEYADAIDAIATHSYPYKQGTPDSAIIDFVAACDKYPEKDRWQTELCNGNQWGATQVDRAILTMGTLNSDMVWGRMNYWLWWIGFDTRYSIDAEYQESLLGGDGVTYVTPSAQYLVLQKLYKNAYAGSRVKRVTSADPEMKTDFALVNHLSAYVNGDHTVVMMINDSDRDKTYQVDGLTGSSASVHTVSNSFEGMQELAVANLKEGVLEKVTLPAKSISVLVTYQKDQAPPALTLDQEHAFRMEDGAFVTRERTVSLSGRVDEPADIRINNARAVLDENLAFRHEFEVGGKEKTVKVTGFDQAENYLKPVFLTYRYDPKYVGVQLLNLPELTNEADFKLRGRTNTKAAVTVNGKSVETDGLNEFELALDLQEGENTLSVSAVDEQGNQSEEKTYTLFCDSHPPVIEARLISPFTNDLECLISGKVSEPVSYVKIQGKAVKVQADLSFSGKAILKEGVNQVPVAAEDIYGNAATVLVEASFVPDEHTAHATDGISYSARATGFISIDGRPAEEDWRIDNKATKLAVGEQSTNIVNFGTLWDDNYLYVAADVVDETLAFDQELVYNNDCIEIFLNPGNEKASMYMKNDRQIFLGFQQGKLSYYQNPGKYELKWQDTDYGFTAEIAIPWSDLGVTPAEGMKIGFDLSNDDNDGRGQRDAVTIWSGTNENYHDTSNFGTLILTTRDKVEYVDMDLAAAAAGGGEEPAPARAVTVKVNGTAIQYGDVEPVLEGEYTMAPVRKTAEALGMQVEWIPETQTAVFTRDGRRVELEENSAAALVDGVRVPLPTQVITRNDRILVPLRFLSEAFGVQVDWEPETLTVVITQ